MSDLSVETINIVFDGPPSHESGRFIEVENLDGASIKAGEWIQLDSERWALQLDVLTTTQVTRKRNHHDTEDRVPEEPRAEGQ